MLRVAIIKECESVRFLPTRSTSAKLERHRDTESGKLWYRVKYTTYAGNTHEVTTTNYVKAKARYEFWRDLVLSS